MKWFFQKNKFYKKKKKSIWSKNLFFCAWIKQFFWWQLDFISHSWIINKLFFVKKNRRVSSTNSLLRYHPENIFFLEKITKNQREKKVASERKFANFSYLKKKEKKIKQNCDCVSRVAYISVVISSCHFCFNFERKKVSILHSTIYIRQCEKKLYRTKWKRLESDAVSKRYSYFDLI